MRHRSAALLAIVSVLGVATVTRARIVGQTSTAQPKPVSPAKKWTPPRTSWGEPDLQGKWSYATVTPLERPVDQTGRDTLSDAEVARVNEEARSGADRRDGTAEADLARAYNAYWYDRGKSTGRTSLI